ncbi:hypothetical protein E2C01_076513 [Portunus trituberculatus]|uniref:Uncharacterized protein n=1 Tax=Portunus trituberculatus TaxID=210409 RepID=A0A5B7IHY9_PORTR|nr:hypothetical protein [Portunus trituberculatus]
MADDLNGQHGHPEQPAAAWESGLLMDLVTSMPGSSGSQSSSESSRWVCLRPDFTRVLGSFCLLGNCRDICNPGKRCGECSAWSSDKILASYKYQCGLRCRRCAKAKHSHSSVAQPFCNVSCDVGTLQSVKAPPSVQGKRDLPAASVLSNIHGSSEISFQDVSVLSQEELTAGDLASQQGTKLPIAVDISLFLKSWQEEVLASVNTLVASQIGDLCGSVPLPPTDPSLPAVPSSSYPDLMQFSVLPPPPQES